MESDQVAHWLELEEKLAKIRQQINSKLENQKHVAIILSAVEENIESSDDQNISSNVVKYLIALMSLLDQVIVQETGEIGNLQLATSTCYLLDLIFHYAPRTLLRSKFAEILTKIAPFITDAKAEAPLIRSAIGCLEALLIAQDAQAWNNTQDLSITPNRGLQGLLQLSLDPRPKVRKRAVDGVSAVLSNPPAAPTAGHVAAVPVTIFAVNSLQEALNAAGSTSNKKLKAQAAAGETNNDIIRALRLVNAIVTTGQWPSQQIEVLCDLLLAVTKSSDQYLVKAAFECFENLFKIISELSSDSTLAESKSLKLLDVIFSLAPSTSDVNLVGSWIAVLVKGLSAYATHQPLKCLTKIPDVFKLMSKYLASETTEVYYSASQCLVATITDAVKDELLLYPPAVDNHTFEMVDQVLSDLSEIFVEFLSVRYIHCAKEVLNVLKTAITKFRYRSYPELIAPLEIVGGWRTSEEEFLELRSEAEAVIAAAITSIGPKKVLSSLPLNLVQPSDSKPGRAWLLPLIRDHTTNTELAVFIEELVPLIEIYQAKCEQLPKESVQLKIFQTVLDQIWSTLPHFCELPVDLEKAFTDKFAADLSSLLYQKVELRTTICHSFKNLVETNLAYINGASADDILLQQHFPVDEATKSLEFSKGKTANLLAVLFNVYTQTAANARGYILETIESYLKIASADDLKKMFDNVCALLKKAMDDEAGRPSKGQPQLSATLLDIVVCMSKYLPVDAYSALFSLFGVTVSSKDALTQKRAYRIITRLAEPQAGAEALAGYISDVEKVMLANSETVQTSSKSARLAAIKTVVDILPSNHLDFIVQVIAEVILATKDVNEKSRELSFETLIAMGKKMNDPNGVISLSKVPGYNPETPDQPSSISEFFKIMAAGLIGESQHMVSSTITAFACLVFEYKDQVDHSVLIDIYDTIELYLTSNSREIAKSAIGFAKVCVLGLPDELMREKVPALIVKLLRWSHEHTGHFKAKVKHIIERLIRKYGYEFVEANFPADDLRLLANIRKTKNRSKRKEEESQGTAASATSNKGSRFMNAFDEAIYDMSDEEKEEEEDESGDGRKSQAKQFIVESNDNPLDLLDSQTLAHISSTRPKKFTNDQKKKMLQDDMFNFDSEGRLIMKNDRKASGDDEDPLKSVTSGINAYLDAVKQGPIRGQKNRLKFRKGARAGATLSDDEDDEVKGIPKRAATNKNKINKGGKKGPKYKSKRKL
ncbi:hypothetical protein HG537_0B05890 [Torulaspora globosa]|uniref:Uncharacterized protein n=1 Tax=Torulaspora globosa TaxID=48254 RepID=A0A7H9HSB1_9SACH|nr:hypothetical protein HG537_0B05890 [Torulaspora sp. CBS 2947]